jgi:hypothetical protein
MDLSVVLFNLYCRHMYWRILVSDKRYKFFPMLILIIPEAFEIIYV